MSNKIVSVVIPVYNMGELLRRSVTEILKQSYQDLEIILIDDGSSDNSLAVCKELSQTDKRIKYFHQENSGSGPARNAGIEHATGKYIYFPDADDILVRNAIETMVSTAEKNDCDMVVFGFKHIYDDGSEKIIKQFYNVQFSGTEVRKNYDRFTGRNCPLEIQGAPWNKFFSLDIVKKYGITYPALRRNQDEVFIMRYVDKTEKIAFCHEILYHHFPNDIKRTFMKFPIDYFEIVSKLNNFRIEYMYSWNKDNTKILNHICESFVDSTTRCLMFLFNPKWDLSFKERLNRMKDISIRCISEMPDKNFVSDSIMYKLMRKKHYILLYFTAYLSLKKYYK